MDTKRATVINTVAAHPDPADGLTVTASLDAPFVMLPLAATNEGDQPEVQGRSLTSGWRVDPTSNLLEPTTGESASADSAANQDQQQLIEPRLMKLLTLLAAEAGEVVDRQRLINALWPRVVVNDNSLNRAVSDLRRALRTQEYTWIQTVPKRGYRLCAQIRTPERKRPDSRRPTPNLRAPDLRAWQRWTPSAAAAVMLALSLWTHFGPHSAAEPSNVVTIDIPEQLLQDTVGARVANNTLPPAIVSNFTQTTHAQVNGEGLPPFQLLGNAVPVTNDAPPPAIVVPQHQLMAYVEQRDGISQLKLRHAFAEDAPWTAFTTDERIQHLQWSPLDDGVLFTVGEARETGSAALVRLMLLDLETLSLHELYRREATPQLDNTTRGGKLT